MHVGLLDRDMLVMRQARARRPAHQRVDMPVALFSISILVSIPGKRVLVHGTLSTST